MIPSPFHLIAFTYFSSTWRKLWGQRDGPTHTRVMTRREDTRRLGFLGLVEAAFIGTYTVRT